MSLFVTADLCIISLGFTEVRSATFECVFVTNFFVIVVTINNLIIIIIIIIIIIKVKVTKALKQWQLRWNSETQNKFHTIEPRVNLINFSVYRADMRLLFTCKE